MGWQTCPRPGRLPTILDRAGSTALCTGTSCLAAGPGSDQDPWENSQQQLQRERLREGLFFCKSSKVQKVLIVLKSYTLPRQGEESAPGHGDAHRCRWEMPATQQTLSVTDRVSVPPGAGRGPDEPSTAPGHPSPLLSPPVTSSLPTRPAQQAPEADV